MPDHDHNLVQRCLQGDAAAFAGLYDRHALRVHRLLSRLTGNATRAEDLTQETFITAYRSLGTWRGEGAFASWLGGIGVRLYRKSLRQPHLRDAELPAEIDLPAADSDNPLDILTRQEAGQQLEAAIAELPDAYREVFVLLWVEEMKQREVAALLELPIGTVQSRLWRAVCLLRKRLREMGVVERQTGDLNREEGKHNALHYRA
jgi:RNA polymerase sigma-70 factor (ECF subfamily)